LKIPPCAGKGNELAAPPKLARTADGLPVIRRLIYDYGLPNWRRYAIAFVLMGIVAATTAITAYLFGDVINEVVIHRDIPAVAMLCVVIVALFTIKGFATYGHIVMLARISNRILAANQRLLFERLIRQNLGFFSDRHSTEFMARLNVGAAAPGQVLNLIITAVGRDLMSLLALLAVMVMQDPILSVVTFLIVPPILFMMRRLLRRVRSLARHQFDSGAATLEALQETLQGIRIVKAYTLEDPMRARIEASIAQVQGTSNKMARVSNRSGPLMETLAGVLIASILLYTGYRMIVIGAEPGAFISFMAAFLLAYEPAKRLARLNIELAAALVGVQVLFEITDSPATEPSDDDKPLLALTAARIEFQDVSFGYRADERVIHGLSFTGAPGEVTALVGPSGGGKSTIFNLILRFYDIDTGAISIDGQNIAKVARRSLRGQIAYVGQDVFLFRGTVRDNIAIGKPAASEAEITAAAKAAQAHAFIMSFPQGYDTPVGEHGLRLSGGERQRIAIARALIKDAPIILLDEATAALDSESEHLVQQAIAELCKGRTTIVIAHRLSTVMHADRILVIEAGQIVESGRHDELMRKGGRYASFYRLQLKQQELPPVAIASGA
jgi:subfamily B ATP-binding cassette protein MsbA